MTFLLDLILKNWKLAFGASVLAAVLLGVTILKHQRDSAREELRILRNAVVAAKKVSDEYKELTDANLNTLRTSIPLMVEQVKKDAFTNFRRKYPNAGAGCSGPLRLPNVSIGAPTFDPAGSTESLDGCPQEFILNAATDAALLAEWQRWARLNRLEVK